MGVQRIPYPSLKCLVIVINSFEDVRFIINFLSKESKKVKEPFTDLIIAVIIFNVIIAAAIIIVMSEMVSFYSI